MKVLFDQGTPVPLRTALSGHAVSIAHKMGWSTLTNGDFLNAAEGAGFEVLVTTDRNIRHQQSMSGRRLAILVLPTTDWRIIRLHFDRITAAIGSLQPGEIRDLRLE